MLKNHLLCSNIPCVCCRKNFFLTEVGHASFISVQLTSLWPVFDGTFNDVVCPGSLGLQDSLIELPSVFCLLEGLTGRIINKHVRGCEDIKGVPKRSCIMVPTVELCGSKFSLDCYLTLFCYFNVLFGRVSMSSVGVCCFPWFLVWCDFSLVVLCSWHTIFVYRFVLELPPAPSCTFLNFCRRVTIALFWYFSDTCICLVCLHPHQATD